MDGAPRHPMLRAGGYALAALVLAAVFMAWLRPDMLVAFATAVMLCF